MNRMRSAVIALIAWLLFLSVLGWLVEPIKVSGEAYLFASLMAILTIFVSQVRKIPLWLLLVVPAPMLLVLKLWAGYDVWGADFVMTVIEVCAISVTTILAHRVSLGLSEFESAVAHIGFWQTGELSESYSTGLAEMYQEVRRARRHQRPLSLLAVEIEEESIKTALDRIVVETQQAMIKRYAVSGVAGTLCDELEDYDIVAQGNDRFLVLLPEATPQSLTALTDELRMVVSERVGVSLRIGTASFPNDAVTFESMVEKACRQAKESKPELSHRSRQTTMEHQAT